MDAEYPLELSDAELARYRFMADAAATTESEWWSAAGVVPGAVVADVGCGPAAVSLVLAGIVGPAGRVVAVDRGPEALAAAREAVTRAGVDNVSVVAGDAHDTGVPPASVDVVMIRHVLAHNGGREEAIVRHAAGLVRPGGCVYVVDTDATAMRTRPADADLDDLSARYQQWHERQGNDLSVGLRLAGLLRAAGLERVEHHGRYQIVPLPPGVRPPGWAARETLVRAGLATAGDLERWAAAFDRADRAEPRPMLFAPLFVAYGYRPV